MPPDTKDQERAAGLEAGAAVEPVISVRHLWKVFGPKAASVPESPELVALHPQGAQGADRLHRRRLATSASTWPPARSSSSWACPAPASPRWCDV